jgi:hypothetical protein
MFDNLTDFFVSAMDAGIDVDVPQPRPENLITIGEPNDPIVTVGFDGTVTIYKHGGEAQAADLFWRAVELRGKSLVSRIVELEEDLAMRHRFMDFGQPLSSSERAAAKRSGIITEELL